MPDSRQSPTVRRRRLGIELRRLREDNGLHQDEVAERLDWSLAKMAAYVEKGVVKWTDVLLLLDVYGVTDDEYRDALITLAKQGKRRGWWQDFDDLLSKQLSTYVGLEAEATSIYSFQLAVVPGLLQTKEYARERILGGNPEIGVEEAERRVGVQMERQKVLRADPPLRLWAVMDEKVLRTLVGGPEVMQAQMRHLVTMGELANVTLQVVPFSRGAHPGQSGSFSIIEFPDVDELDTVYSEDRVGGLFYEDPKQIQKFRRAYEHLQATALDPVATIELIAEACG